MSNGFLEESKELFFSKSLYELLSPYSRVFITTGIGTECPVINVCCFGETRERIILKSRESAVPERIALDTWLKELRELLSKINNG